MSHFSVNVPRKLCPNSVSLPVLQRRHTPRRAARRTVRPVGQRGRGMDSSGHLQVLLLHRHPPLSLRRADLQAQVRLLDL